MGSVVTSRFGSRRWTAGPSLPTLGAVALALLALALADGGGSGLALGATTALIWILLGAALLGGLLDPIEPRGMLLGAAGCLAALAALTALSLSWGSDAGAGFVDVVRSLGYLGAFVLAGLAVRRGGGPGVLVTIAVAGVSVALVALGSRLLGIGSGDAALAAELAAASGRLSYPIGYWNALGAMMAVTVPVLLWVAGEARGERWRALALAAGCPSLLAAYMASSRGTILALGAGAVVVVAFAGDRRRSLAALVVAAGAVMPAIIAATIAPGILTTPGDGFGGAEAAVAAALVAGCVLAYAFGDRAVEGLAGSPILRVRLPARTLLGAAAAAAAGLVLLAGPSALIGDFRAPAAGARAEAGIVSASGSGRAQFWAAALHAWEEAPLKGIGAGGYGSYWNRNGTLGTPAPNAHSEPLELLAELGIAGLALFAAFIAILLWAGLRAVGAPQRAPAGAALAIVLTGLVGFGIDWTWDVPAVGMPVLLAGALLAGSAFEPAPERAGGPAAGGLGAQPRQRTFPLAPLPATLAVLALAVPAIWAGGVQAIASSRLGASDDALERGQLNEAAAAARAAAAVEPWSAEPWLQLAGVEQAAENFQASQRAASEAVERAPDDYRAWLLASYVQARLGGAASAAYASRGAALAPLLLLRAKQGASRAP